MPSACVRPNIPYIPAALRAVVPDAKPTAQEACSVRYLVDQASPMKGGTLPTRGVSSYRKLRKPGAGARVARFCPFSCFHCGAALWENHPRRTAPLPLAKKRFVEFGGYRKTVPLHRPRSGSAPPRTDPASPGGRAFCWIRGISKGRELGARSGRIIRAARLHFPWRESVSSNSEDAQKARVGNGPRCMIPLNGSGRKLMAHA